MFFVWLKKLSLKHVLFIPLLNYVGSYDAYFCWCAQIVILFINFLSDVFYVLLEFFVLFLIHMLLLASFLCFINAVFWTLSQYFQCFCCCRCLCESKLASKHFALYVSHFFLAVPLFWSPFISYFIVCSLKVLTFLFICVKYNGSRCTFFSQLHPTASSLSELLSFVITWLFLHLLARLFEPGRDFLRGWGHLLTLFVQCLTYLCCKFVFDWLAELRSSSPIQTYFISQPLQRFLTQPIKNLSKSFSHQAHSSGKERVQLVRTL